jgi:hypothetical protein
MVHRRRHGQPRMRRSALGHSPTLYGGLDVHQAPIAVAAASEERGAEVVFLGTIGTQPCDLDILVRTRQSTAQPLRFVDEAGPGWDW